MNADKEQFDEIDDILKQYLKDIEIEPSPNLYEKVRKRRKVPFWLFGNMRFLLTLIILISTLSVYLSINRPDFLKGSSEQTADIKSKNSPVGINSDKVDIKTVNDNTETKTEKSFSGEEISKIDNKKENSINDSKNSYTDNKNENPITETKNLQTESEQSFAGTSGNADNKSQNFQDDIISVNNNEKQYGSPSALNAGEINESINSKSYEISEKVNRDAVANENNSEISDTKSEFSLNISVNPDILSAPQKMLPMPLAHLNNYVTNKDPIYGIDRIYTLHKTPLWFVEVFHEINFNNCYITPQSEETKTIAENKAGIISGSFNAANAGVQLGFRIENSSLKAGVSIQNYHENYADHNLPLKPELSIQQIYNGNLWTFNLNDQYYYVDTSNGYFHYIYIQDSVTHVIDSMWESVYDTSTVNIFDTVQVQLDKSMKYQKRDFTYRLYEFPLIYSYEYCFGHYGISFSGGVIPGILAGRPVYYFNGNYFEYLQQDVTCNKFVISASCMLGVKYWLNERSSLFFNAGYKRGLNSVYAESSGISQRIYSVFFQYGVSVNIK